MRIRGYALNDGLSCRRGVGPRAGLSVVPVPLPSKPQHQSHRSFAKVSSLSLTSKKRHGHKITMVTAYDYPSAIHVARAGIDIVLVGDSVAMVELGHETTQPMTVQAMIHHCQSVKRGVAAASATNEPL